MINLVSGLFHNEEATKKALAEFILTTDRLSIGPQCAKFESDFSAWQERRHCSLYNSGSSANLALIQALINLERLKPGDKVAFSAITWATNVMPLIQLGLEPIAVDVEPTTFNSSSQHLEATLAAHPDIKAFFITNLLGLCSDIDQIKKVCDERDIILIEDNCESLGTVYQDTKLGNWGLASTFSFFVGHHMSTIEGGAICTDDQELDRMLRLVRAHGWDRNLSEEEKQQLRAEHEIEENFFANFTFYTLGYNLRPTEITGFVGQQELPHLDEMITAREANFHRFSKAFATNPDILPIQSNHIDLVSSFCMPVVLKSKELAKQYIRRFTENEIEVRPIVGGSMPDQPFFTKQYGKQNNTPNAQMIDQQGFYFGNHPRLTQQDIDQVCQLCEVAPAHK